MRGSRRNATSTWCYAAAGGAGQSRARAGDGDHHRGGPLSVRLKESGAIRNVEVPAGETWRFTIPPGVVHPYRNTGEGLMVLVSFSTRLHDPNGSDTRREQIL